DFFSFFFFSLLSHRIQLFISLLPSTRQPNRGITNDHLAPPEEFKPQSSSSL
ncbi:unnamed protein product, partial [Bubo scandiacus]